MYYVNTQFKMSVKIVEQNWIIYGPNDDKYRQYKEASCFEADTGRSRSVRDRRNVYITIDSVTDYESIKLGKSSFGNVTASITTDIQSSNLEPRASSANRAVSKGRYGRVLRKCVSSFRTNTEHRRLQKRTRNRRRLAMTAARARC